MTGKVSGETPLKVVKDQVMFGPSANGYTFAYGTSKEGPFTSYPEAVPAGESLIVNGIMQYSWVKLVGNTGEVEVIL